MPSMAATPLSEPEVTVARDGAVATVVMNRPGRLNATTDAMGNALEDALLAQNDDPAVRVIVLTGAGGNFCVGGDIARLDEVLASGGADLVDRAPGKVQPKFRRIGNDRDEFKNRYMLPAALDKPVVAAVEGICAGIGIVLALACDYRIVAHNATFAAAFPQRGLIAESGIAFLLSRVGGYGLAAKLLLACRRLDGKAAFHHHLADELAAPGDALKQAQALAQDMAATLSPRSAAVIKAQILAAQHESFAQATQRSFRSMMESFAHPDFREGLESFKEKRPARFRDWPDREGESA